MVYKKYFLSCSKRSNIFILVNLILINDNCFECIEIYLNFIVKLYINFFIIKVDIKLYCCNRMEKIMIRLNLVFFNF